MEGVLQEILSKLNQMGSEVNEIRQTMATKDELNEIRQTMVKGFEEVNKKLNSISAQVAYNTEQNSRINQLEMDVRVIKKAIANL